MINLEEKIKIDGEEIPKSQIDKIAKIILKRCNFVHSKNKNNTSVLKSKQGKLMFTGGMTVNEFTNKYNLK